MDVPALPPRSATQLVQLLLDHLPAMVGYWDHEARNRLANRAYFEWFGVTPEQMRGMHISQLLGPEVYELNRPYIERVLEGEEQHFERELTTVSGETRHIQAVYIPDIIDGDVRGFFVLATDITQRVAAEQRHRRSADQYRALTRSLPGAFALVFDDTLRFTIAEGEALRAFGYGREDLEGAHLAEVAPPERLATIEARYRAALRGETSTWERKADDRIWELTAGPVRDASGIVFAGMVVGTEITERRRREATLEALHVIASEVARNASPHDVMDQVARTVRELFEVERAAVVRFEPGSRATIVAMAPDVDDVDREFTLEGDPSAAALVSRTGRPAVVRYEPGAIGPTGQAQISGLHGAAAAPVSVRGALWGVVNIGTTEPERITPETTRRLVEFAHLVELAIGNAEAWETLARHAMTDGLTGLPNHRAFQEQLAREVVRATRHHEALSVIILDVDHFKAVNDTFGHHVGDRVLAEIARRLHDSARAGELVARIGGEEFGWILPETTAVEAHIAADRARLTISAEPFEGVGTLTISAGVCDMQEAEDAVELMRFADRALYAAKASGRDMAHRFTRAAEELLAAIEPPEQRFQLASSIRALARAIDAKDLSTREHSGRVAHLAMQLALELGWTARRARRLHAAALLHDVGKIGIADHVLFKHGALDGAERAQVQQHAALGAQIAAEALEPEEVRWVRSHHERWDGTGYPDRLAGADISDGAQLLGLADAWDAMTMTRTYGVPLTADEALAECERCSGTQFAPASVRALRALHERGELETAHDAVA